jgi:hypothetical protein
VDRVEEREGLHAFYRVPRGRLWLCLAPQTPEVRLLQQEGDNRLHRAEGARAGGERDVGVHSLVVMRIEEL